MLYLTAYTDTEKVWTVSLLAYVPKQLRIMALLHWETYIAEVNQKCCMVDYRQMVFRLQTIGRLQVDYRQTVFVSLKYRTSEGTAGSEQCMSDYMCDHITVCSISKAVIVITG